MVEGFVFLYVIIGILCIIWSILCLVLFFKIWGMTNDIRKIKEFLMREYVQVPND